MSLLLIITSSRCASITIISFRNMHAENVMLCYSILHFLGRPFLKRIYNANLKYGGTGKPRFAD